MSFVYRSQMFRDLLNKWNEDLEERISQQA